MNDDSKYLPILENANPRVKAIFESTAIHKQFSAGTQLAMEGAVCHYFFVVISGIIRVFKLGDTGREITLYRVNPNQSCILTSFGVLSQTPFPAFAIAETDVELLMVTAADIRDWVDRYDVWRKHLFENMTIRLNEILNTIEKVAFQRLDVRLAEYLLSHFPADMRILKITHEQLGRELGSSRVPVSRILEEWENDGAIELARGKIIILNREQLREKLHQ